MSAMNSIKEQIKLNLSKRVIPVACVLFLTGCKSLPYPFNGTLETNSTQSITTTISQPIESTGAPSPGTSQPNLTTTAVGTVSSGTVTATAPTKPTRAIALEKFQTARLTLTSEKMNHLWSVESKYPLKTGQNIAQSNYSPTGTVTTAKGSAIENYAGKETKRDWYLTADGFFVGQDGEIQRYSKDQGSEQSAYDFNHLVEIILTKYSVSEETGSYFVVLTTQEEAVIKELMECLGYRKTVKDAYQGSLYLEAILEETTGHLRAVNYVYKNSLEGFSDNGQITFSEWNSPIVVVVPEQATTSPHTQTTPSDTSPATSTTPTTTSITPTTTSTKATSTKATTTKP